MITSPLFVDFSANVQLASGKSYRYDSPRPSTERENFFYVIFARRSSRKWRSLFRQGMVFDFLARDSSFCRFTPAGEYHSDGGRLLVAVRQTGRLDPRHHEQNPGLVKLAGLPALAYCRAFRLTGLQLSVQYRSELDCRALQRPACRATRGSS